MLYSENAMAYITLDKIGYQDKAISPYNNYWAPSCENVLSGICGQRTPRSKEGAQVLVNRLED